MAGSGVRSVDTVANAIANGTPVAAGSGEVPDDGLWAVTHVGTEQSVIETKYSISGSSLSNRMLSPGAGG